MDRGRDPTGRAAFVDAGAVEAATAAMERPGADDQPEANFLGCRCGRTLRQQCQWALNIIDPPAYALAIYLCLLVAAAGCAVASHRRSRGLPACTRAGWLAALLLLHLGAGAVLLAWAATLGGDGNFALRVHRLLGMFSFVLVPGTALSGLPPALVVCIGEMTADPDVQYIMYILLVIVVVIWAFAVAWREARQAKATQWPGANQTPTPTPRGVTSAAAARDSWGHLCCCCAGLAGGTCVTLCTCAGIYILLWQVGLGDTAA